MIEATAVLLVILVLAAHVAFITDAPHDPAAQAHMWKAIADLRRSPASTLSSQVSRTGGDQ
jgi:hypothetical protein